MDITLLDNQDKAALESLVKKRTGVSVTEYGAKGDGATNDTAAFKEALLKNRVLFVPGGPYKLTEGIEVRDNCELELSQDTVL